MNENLNLVEILKDCPKGTKLYSTIYGDVYFEGIVGDLLQYPIRFSNQFKGIYSVTKEGLHELFYIGSKYVACGECTLFPSKDQRDWSKWHRPFIDGDILFTYTRGAICNYEWLSIFKRIIDNKCETYVDMNISVGNRDFYINDDERKYFCDLPEIIYQRLATEEEKKHLFDVIREKGYTWNVNDKKLEKTHKCIFDIKTLKPFDRVLVRDVNNDYWNVNLFSSYLRGWNSPFLCIGKEGYRQCVPYEGNEHLLGTTNDCNDFYKIWED